MVLDVSLQQFQSIDTVMIIPDELDLLAFFEGEPIGSMPEDGYFCYKYSDDRDIELFFSFHEIEESIQARLMQSNCELAVISGECADRITIEEDGAGEYLACVFKLDQAEFKAEIRLRPSINIRWHTLKS